MGLMMLGTVLIGFGVFSWFGGGGAIAGLIIVIGLGTSLTGALRIAARHDRS